VSRRASVLATVILSALAAAVVTVAISGSDAPFGVMALGFAACVTAFAIWPWAVLPTGILLGTSVTVWAGRTDVRSVAVVHLVPIVAGWAGLVVRRAFTTDAIEARERRTILLSPPSIGMAGAGALAMVAALYGLALGNHVDDVLAATYHLGVIPLYYFTAIATLASREWRQRAAIAYLVVVTVLTAISMTSPGRHGGLLSSLPIPLLLVAMSRTSGTRRVVLAFVTAVLAIDVVLGSYRGIWVALAIALGVLAVRGGQSIRTGLFRVGVLCVIGAAAVVAAATVSNAVRDRLSAVGDAFTRGTGYRAAEARIGLHVFAERPLFGAGAGQSTPPQYVTDFGITTVGPIYHAFYIVLLANVGLVGLVVVLSPIVRATWMGLRSTDLIPVALAALTAGYLVAAIVISPTDGHWELGLLPALTVLTLRSATVDRDLPVTSASMVLARAGRR
jgi:hypothetical protein